MTTTKEQVQEVLEEGDTLEELDCLYRPWSDDSGRWLIDEPVRCKGTELPERKFNEGYGGVNGEQCICFSKKYVYIKVTYDGAEWFQAFPKDIEYVILDQVLPSAEGG